MCLSTARATKYVPPPVNSSYPDCGQMRSMRTQRSTALHLACECDACKCQGAFKYSRWQVRRENPAADIYVDTDSYKFVR